jgi:hypothetical protein
MTANVTNKSFARIRADIVDAATGATVKEGKWQSNLIFDSGLNALAAGGLGYGNFFAACKAGASNAPNSYASGAITFTQSGNTVTASAPFFTAAMVGALLKYGASGSGGAEYYITVFTNSTQVTVNTSASVSATAGTVWMVNLTGLQQSFSSLGNNFVATNTYDTVTVGANFTNWFSDHVVMQRTFLFAVQSATYAVNEIGYYNGTGSGGTCFGRIVLPSTDTVTTSQYYRVTMQMTLYQTPNSIVTVGNVGGSFDTSGTAATEFWDVSYVDTNGNTQKTDRYGPSSCLDLTNVGSIGFYIQPGLTLQSSIQAYNAGVIYSNGFVNNTGPVVTVAATGVSHLTFGCSKGTNSETIYGIMYGGSYSGNNIKASYLQLFTTPVALPATGGNFAATIVLQIAFVRMLTN